jgi:redox-regulated HSP33 family molecular chaperone
MVKMLRMRESASTGMRKVEEMLEGLRSAEMEVLSVMSRATSFSCSCNTVQVSLFVKPLCKIQQF